MQVLIVRLMRAPAHLYGTEGTCPFVVILKNMTPARLLGMFQPCQFIKIFKNWAPALLLGPVRLLGRWEYIA